MIIFGTLAVYGMDITANVLDHIIDLGVKVKYTNMPYSL